MRQSDFYLGGLGALAAILALVISLESEVVAAGRPQVDPGAAVNRVLKGDRLPVIPGRGASDARPADTRPAEVQQPKLPDECNAIFNAKRNMFSTEVAGRCVG
jgi:hypothetical protein